MNYYSQKPPSSSDVSGGLELPIYEGSWFAEVDIVGTSKN
ncbi:hypothetical protein BFJ70_g5524 [Fusarium oxysporum]|uniref:Uncharacterized protein n=1 Tax=Fusarium oxysporum f. sp. cepae TaxID=396571 RepID=A0A3L6P038_FUSOX|nr:hypothetical protein BFJ65_g3416 [Fusarium oxysporum f. sp. cepae]RKK59109.1 hypothetical protein BFJ67_g2640 [Fusarium oxysporum f. sp. cepae]RKK64142.1 hypothetical protein BFJ66_g37 [Fusarium oxysporum f. sp. cepae]RKL40294.1 hypothetical protein BFJ70_g5524 [Fusarium oxysporum]